MTKNIKKNPGFTFIELIIAVTIFAIVAVSIYSTFNAGIRVWLKTSPMIEEVNERRFSLLLYIHGLQLGNFRKRCIKLPLRTNIAIP